MKYLCQMLPFLLYLFVATTNEVRACGSHDANHVDMFHQTKTAAAANNPSTSLERNTHCCEGDSNSPCSEEQDDKHCHCPGCGVAGHGFSLIDFGEFSFSSPVLPGAAIRRQAFYFAEHLPEAVYLSIWHPPKLNA